MDTVKKIIISCVGITIGLCFMMTIPSNVNSADKEVKIATVSLTDILTKSAVGQDARKVLEEKVVELQTKIQKEQETQDQLRAEIEKKSSMWSEEVKLGKERELLKKGQEIKLMSEDAQFELQNLEKKLMEPLLKELHTVIGDVGKENGYTLILENTKKGLESPSGLLYAAETLDISDLVREVFEKRIATKK